MSEQLPQHPARKTHATPATHETRRGERGFITPGMALGIGKAALALVLVGTPIVAGLSYGARSTAPDLMTGQIAVTDPAKVEILDTKIERELCIANSTVKVSAGVGFEGHPLGNNLKGDVLGIPYNLNLERSMEGDVYRKVHYCVKGMDIPYTYDPNIAFGDPAKRAITAELSLSRLIVMVSALNDGRDEIHPVSDGVLGYFASDLAKYLEQKSVQNLIGKENAQGADVQNNIDNILRGVFYAYTDQQAAIGCLKEAEDYDWQNSPVGQLLTKAGVEAIQEDFLNKDRNRPQPSANDISFKLVGDITTDSTPNILNQKKNSDMESALNLMTKPALEDGSSRQLTIAGVNIPIEYVTTSPTSTTGTCVVNPETAVTTLTPGDKGEG